jgi:hypothetical protein
MPTPPRTFPAPSMASSSTGPTVLDPHPAIVLGHVPDASWPALPRPCLDPVPGVPRPTLTGPGEIPRRWIQLPFEGPTTEPAFRMSRSSSQLLRHSTDISLAIDGSISIYLWQQIMAARGFDFPSITNALWCLRQGCAGKPRFEIYAHTLEDMSTTTRIRAIHGALLSASRSSLPWLDESPSGSGTLVIPWYRPTARRIDHSEWPRAGRLHFWTPRFVLQWRRSSNVTPRPEVYSTGIFV